MELQDKVIVITGAEAAAGTGYNYDFVLKFHTSIIRASLRLAAG
jgi:hypothetical protein